MIMAKCCIIGGVGFIGSHLVKKLALTNRELLVIDKAPKTKHNDLNALYIQGDYGKTDFLQKTLSDIDEIILLAHSTTPKTSFEHSMEDLLANIPSAVNFFESVSRISLRKIVFVSSGGTVYGRATKIPITEDHPTLPISPYGITKLTIEKYSYMYHVLKHLPIVCVRPANAYGDGQRPFSGQGFISTAMGAVLIGQQVNVFGNRGTIRDYLYIEDLVDGIIAALESGIPGESYNLGTGIGRDNIDVLEDIFLISGCNRLEVKVNILAERPFDVPVNILDSTKLHNLSGWKPHVKFEDGLKRMWEWFLQQKVIIS